MLNFIYSCEIRKATVACAFFEISLKKLKLTNSIGKWLKCNVTNKAY